MWEGGSGRAGESNGEKMGTTVIKQQFKKECTVSALLHGLLAPIKEYWRIANHRYILAIKDIKSVNNGSM